MNKKVKVVTFSARFMGYKQEEILVGLETRLKECRGMHADLICFTEVLLHKADDNDNPNWVENYHKALEISAKYAAELRAFVVINLWEPSVKYPGKKYQTTFLFNREGKIIHKYRKHYITYRAIGWWNGLPGEKVEVIDTEIGRIGFATCFDAGWRSHWEELARQGAELVVWCSAYHGGHLINGYAAIHSYYVITSVHHDASRIISPLGNDIACSNCWDGCATAEIYPGSIVCHMDHHYDYFRGPLRIEYGDRVFFRHDAEGNVFEMASLDPTLDINDVLKKFNMISYKDYHAQYTKENEELRQQFPEIDD